MELSQKIGYCPKIVVLAGVLMPSALNAAIIDTMDSAANFALWTKDSVTTNTTTATANGNGTVTLTRNTSADSGANWYSTSPIAITSETNTLVLALSGQSTGSYTVVIHFNGVNNSTIANNEYTWVNWTTSAATKTLDSISAIAPTGAASYYVKFRVQNGQSLIIDQIAAVPEPAAGVLMMLGFAGYWLRRRATSMRW